MSLMKKANFLLMVLLCTCTGIFAQKQNVYLIKDNGQYVQKQDSADYVRIVQEPDKGSALYPINEFYKDGKIRSMGLSRRIDPPLYEGLYRSMYNNGNKKQVATYEKGKLNGQVLNYYPNGQLYTNLVYNNAPPGSELVSYQIIGVNDSTGKPLVQDGNGLCAFYDEGFKVVTSRGMIKNGEYDGVWTGEDPSLHVTYKETYAGGKLISGESTDENQVTLNYTRSHIQPQFKGGMDKFYKYLGMTIRYPRRCQEMGIQGTAVLNFSVEKDGSLTNIRVVNYVNEELGAEAVRVLQKSPPWIPGVMRGRVVRVAYTVPISFNLSR
jgi:TonB family protein